MIHESNQEMVRRRLLECLSRDRTKNQVSEITSLGLVQMTRKKIGVGLLETFGETCECCGGRGVMVHDEPRFKMPEDRSQNQKRGKKKDKPEIIKKVVTAEQADVLKNVVNMIAQAPQSEDASAPNFKEPEGKTEILNKVLESLPEPEPKAKPKRRRVTAQATNMVEDSSKE